MDPKSIQNDAREVPGGHPGPPWGLPRVGPGRFSEATENLWKIEGFWEAPGTSQEAPGHPEDPPNSPQNRFFGEKGHFKLGFFVVFFA